MKKCYTYHTFKIDGWSPKQAQAFWASGNIGIFGANWFMGFIDFIWEQIRTIYTGVTARAVAPVLFLTKYTDLAIGK